MKRIAAIVLAALLAGCAYTYPVTDAGDGVYFAESPPDYTYVDGVFYDPFAYPYWYTAFYHPYYPYYPWFHDRHRPYPYPYAHSVKPPYRSPSEVQPGRPGPSIPLVYRDYPLSATDGYPGPGDLPLRSGKPQHYSRGMIKPGPYGAPAKPSSRAAYAPKSGAPSAAGPSRPMRASPPRAPRAAGSRPSVRSSAPPQSRQPN